MMSNGACGRPRRVWMATAVAALLGLPVASTAGPWEVGGTTPGKNTALKLELAWKHTASKDTWTRPVLKFGGPLAENLSYEVSGGYGAVEKQGQPTRSGMKDFTGKLKWGLMSEADRGVDLLLEPKLTFDTGDVASGVGGGVTTLKLPLRVGKSYGKVHLTGEVRYTHGFDGDYADLAGYGGLVEYKPSSRWVVGVDLINDRPVHGGGDHWRSNVAFKYKPDKHWEWQGLLGRSIHNERGSMATSVKVELAYKF